MKNIQILKEHKTGPKLSASACMKIVRTTYLLKYIRITQVQ